MRVGFIATSNRGKPVAANLGHQVTVHDLRRGAATNLLEMGAQWAASRKEPVPGNEAVRPPRPGSRSVEAVALDEKGIPESGAKECGGPKLVLLKLAHPSSGGPHTVSDECYWSENVILNLPKADGESLW